MLKEFKKKQILGKAIAKSSPSASKSASLPAFKKAKVTPGNYVFAGDKKSGALRQGTANYMAGGAVAGMSKRSVPGSVNNPYLTNPNKLKSKK